MKAALPDKAFLTPVQVAREIGVQGDTVLAWIHSRQLLALDVSRGAGQRPRWRISRADLEAFLESRRTASPAPAPERKRRQAVKIPRHV